MKKYIPFSSLFILMLFSISTIAQIKPHLKDLKSTRSTPYSKEEMKLNRTLPVVPNAQTHGLQAQNRQFSALPPLTRPIQNGTPLKIQVAPKTGLPIVIQGTIKNLPEGDYQTQCNAYLSAVKSAIQIENPEEEFLVTKVETDDLGQTHIRMQQTYMEIPVYGSEVILHQQNGAFTLFNGRYYPTPQLDDLNPAVAKSAAEQTILQDLGQKEAFKTLTAFEMSILNANQIESELVIFHQDKNPDSETLAWHFTVIPSLVSKWSYFVDANTGEILQKYSHVCKLDGGFDHSHHAHANSGEAPHHCSVNLGFELPPDGPAIANATDLFGVTRTINTYEVNNTFYMLDGSRSMFNGTQSNLPNDPVGTIWTIDAQNTSPANNDFAAAQISSSNNNWNNPSAVSAHYNGSKAYEYFLNTFSRNSINGSGGNIVSFINTEDENGGDMDNAFWTGAAIFYGNGNVGFSSPLSKSLDVAGHEMSHGVVQTTANLEYLGESGALNESFADIFGAMIDRDDWLLGEDVVNSGIYTSGALRDMQFPNNGGSSLNDAGYQPDHVNEQYTGTQDNGGVHINSGITNRAYYLFATEVGKDKAEQIYYRALTNYLVKSSQFVDLRIAVVQAATDLHGSNSTEVNAAKDALSAVGIGEGSGTNTQTDQEFNPGDDFVLMTDFQNGALYIFTPEGDPIANPLSEVSPLSKPSITDDGSEIVYVDENKNIQLIEIDWGAGSFTQDVLSSNPIWRNVAVSKDGTKLAALTDDLDNRLLIFDLTTSSYPEEFELYNPTTGSGGPISDDVQYADIIEFDFTGQWVMYDAFNSLTNASGQNIEYWDIGFINVFDNSSGNFEDGYVSKLFSGLPENTSVGNPTFSKNSDYIIALDFIDEFAGDYAILGVNIETGDVGTILNTDDLGYPNYSMTDERIVFNDEPGLFDNSLLSFVNLQDDKISGAGGVQDFIIDGRWGVWFANGVRDLSSTTELNLNGEPFVIYPNPVANQLTIQTNTTQTGEVQIEVFNAVGHLVYSSTTFWTAGENLGKVDLTGLTAGAYYLKITRKEGSASARFLKLEK